ncbi:hemagglutinin repeat-containing protein [Escherichia coli]|nr:hemagglutinin repeat-containing protein [Escherichia coli]
MNQPPVHFTYRLLSYLVSAIIAGQPLLPAVGAVITPQNGAGMDKAANGVPVVNIATPNGAGISHNRFTDYNVGKEGLILNNATGKLNPTQLGGLIQNNPNLKAGGEAKGIINEVTGGNRSLLQGYTEVAGKAANVMVANPYGITCDGCGFINTPHATLTTGRPVMNADGSLQALEVTEGSITINGAGLDGTRSDAVSIIARATEVNAALHAKDLTVTAGANRITADGRVSALKGEGDVPKVAVDTGALGGMYARRIHLTSTESGVGVNLGISDDWPLPSGNNGYLVPSTDPDSPYLITVNPKLDGLGQVDSHLFAGLYELPGAKPGQAPRETAPSYTDEKQFLGSSYFLDRLGLKPEKDYRFLGDAVFDTRYVSNAVLSRTGSRYINGLGSDTEQMRYLMDNAARQQKGLGLEFGVALTVEQIAQLDGSILWWESVTINGQTVMVPKLYLSPEDITLHNGSVISGNNVQLAGGNITNSGGSINAQNGLSLDSTGYIDNLNAGLISAGGSLDLSAIGDISNISSVISGKTVQLESVSGNISNITRRQQWNAGSDSRYGGVHLSGTDTGPVATIKGTDSLSLDAGKNIDITGATVSSGGTLGMSAGNDINIAANLISGSKSQSGFWHTDDNSASSTTSQGSSISAGGNLAMAAGHNLDVTASSVSAGHSALLSAGNDLSLNAVRESKNSRNGRSESHESHAAVSTVTAGDNLLLVAGRDVASQAAGVAAENNVVIRGGRDVNLVAESAGAGDSYTSKKKKEINETVRQQGTEIASGGDTTVNAGRDITAVASSVTATGNISVNAGRDVALTTATESDYHYLETKKKSGGFLSKKTTHTISEDSASREAGSLLSGNRVTVNAGDNLTVEGSDVVADQDVSLAAGNHVDVLAATSTDTSWRFKETKKSGLMGTGGIGFTIGSSKTTHDRREAGTTQSQSASTIGSTAGNVSITAGKQAHISGSDVIANRDISITGDSVVVDPGHDRRTVDEKFEQKKSGLTVALSGTVGSAINNAVTSAQETKESSDSRLKVLQATKTALSGVQAGQAAAMATATGDPNATGVSLSLTTQKSKSQQHSESDTVSGSTLNAGNNLSVVATGKNRGDNRGDIVIAGSQLKAGGNTSLDAANDVLLSGAANTQKTTGRNSSSGGGVGVSIGASGNGAGISVFASVNAAKGSEKGNGTEWTETTIDSGKTVTINSGRDTVLNGVQVNGNRIIADVGHDLLISSQQDTSKYDSKQTSVAAGGSFTFGSMTGSGYIAASRDKMKSRFDSVAEQTGMFAGDGGFDITVGRHTQLDGAVIASTATPDKNHLDTGTLGFSDLHNEADYKVSHSGISLSGGGSFGDKFQGNMPGGMISAGGHSGHAEGTTQAAVADGTITIRDRDNQKQNLANLSRDPAHANDSISPIFDKEKEQRRLQTVGLISDIGSQVADIARTQGELNALKAAKEATGETLPANATEKQRQEYLAKLRDTQAYRNEMAKYGTGSEIQRGIQAAMAALQGLAGGNMAGALAGASAPELANIIGHHAGIDDNTAAKAIAHAILGGVTAALQGNSAAAGAIGAGTGEVIASAIAKSLYPDVDPSKLTEEQKQTVSTLATLSAGMAGGIASGDVAGAAAGAGAGKNVVENNSLAHVLAAAEANKAGTAEKWQEEQQAAIREACSGGTPVSCETAVAAMGSAMVWPLLPGAAATTSLIGAGANAGIGLLINGEVNPNDVILGYWTGVFTAGTRLWGTMGVNAASGATSSYLKGDDPLKGGAMGGMSSGLGYGAGKVLQGQLDKFINPNWKNWEWVDVGMGISKPMPLDPLPGVIGNMGGSASTEYINDRIGKSLSDKSGDKK